LIEYLVGRDGLLRNESRFLVESLNSEQDTFIKQDYINALTAFGTDKEIIDDIKGKKTSIGLQEVETVAVQNALNGNSGFETFDDYRGVPVLSAFAPLRIR